LTLGTNHNVVLSFDGGTPFDCTVSTYAGSATGETVEEITVAPNYAECDTTPIEPPHNMNIIENGCKFTFTVNTTPATSHNALRVGGCESSSHGVKGIAILHPNCTIVIPEQTATGVTYDNVAPSGKNEIILTSTLTTLTAHYETGICVFLGTKHTAALTGSMTVQGFDSNSGERVGITATG
jgi:hypothetical protein